MQIAVLTLWQVLIQSYVFTLTVRLQSLHAGQLVADCRTSISMQEHFKHWQVSNMTVHPEQAWRALLTLSPSCHYYMPALCGSSCSYMAVAVLQLLDTAGAPNMLAAP